MKIKLASGLALLAALGAATIGAAAWYDEGPDEALTRQWEGRPRVEDKDNLFFAMIATDRASNDPLHVTGRRLFDNPGDESVAQIRSPDKDVREFVNGVRSECIAITADTSITCLYRHLPAEQIGDAEKRLSEQYLALRRYPAYRSELRYDAKMAPGAGFLNAHAMHIATHLAVEDASQLVVKDLVEDTLFARKLMSDVDSLLAHVVAGVMVERNYRLIADAIGEGNASQVAALKPVLQPLSDSTLDLKRNLAFKHAEDRIQYASYRRALAADQDPWEEFSRAVEQPSPFAEAGLTRRLQALLLKPGMTSNAILADTRESLGEPATRKPPGPVDSILNATAVKTWSPSGPAGGWKSYLWVMSDLDHFVRLVSLVGALSERRSFEPAQVVSEWNSKLGAQAQSYRLAWDDKRSAFSFDPQSARLRDRAKKSGHGVLVSAPAYLVQEAETWRGFTARCEGQRCELRRSDGPPIAARPRAPLPKDAGPFLYFTDVKPGEYLGLSSLEQNGRGFWFERRVRLRVAKNPA